MSRPRVVIDTNVLISAALKPASQQALIIQLVAFRAIEMCVSDDVLVEYREVFSRPKFVDLDRTAVSRLLAIIEAEATLVIPTERLSVSEHASDNRFYECAAAAAADYIVTGNARHFKKPYKETRILTSRQLLDLIAGTSMI